MRKGLLSLFLWSVPIAITAILISVSDGTAQPIPVTSCRVLGEAGATYVLQNDVVGPTTPSTTCFVITQPNVTLDLNGWTLLGGSNNAVTRAIVVGSGHNNITITNGVIENWLTPAAISGFNTHFSAITDVTFRNITGEGIGYSAFRSGTISNNTFDGVFIPLRISGSANSNIIENNVVRNTSRGFRIFFSSNNEVRDNHIEISSCPGDQCWGVLLEEGTHSTLLQNNNITFSSGIQGRAIIDNSFCRFFLPTCDNFLVYSNSFGEISWSDPDFLLDLDVRGDLSFPGNILIDENTASVNAVAFTGGIVDTIALIILNGVTNAVFPVVILRDGVECTDCNLISYNGSTGVFNVPNFSSYSLRVDSDGDGVPDNEDNCPTVFNPDQEQTGNNVDGDFGDACVSPDVTIPGGATVEPGAIIESGTDINKGVTVKAGAQVGPDAILGKNSTVEADAVVGANTELKQGNTVGEGAIIGMNVVLNQGTEVFAGAKVGDNSIVGKDSDIFENAVVGCFAAPTSFAPVCAGAAVGAQLGRNVTVQAGAVVADGAMIPKNTIVSP